MQSTRPTRRRTIAALALCGFAYLYVVPYQPRINNPNENVRFYMTAAIVEEGTYVIDTMRARWGWVNDCAVRDGHAYSVKAPATSLLGVPFYWAYYQLTEHTGHDYDREEALWVCRVFASILPWLLFLFWFHRWLGRHATSALVRDAVFVSVALGSCVYGYGLLFMSHTLSAAAAFLAFGLLFDARRAGRVRWGHAFLAGLYTAAITWLEYPGFVASALLALYGLFALRPIARLVPFALGGAIPTLSMMHFQWRCFGSPFSPGHLYVESDFLRGRHEEGFFGAVGIQWDALYGLLVDPGAGLFPLTPILVFGVVGLGILISRRYFRVDGIVVTALLLFTILGIAVMNNWRGGWTIGPRYLVIAYPFLAWAALFGLAPAWRRAPRVTGAVALGLTAVGLLLSGAPSAYYPHYPIEIDRPLTQVVLVLIDHGYAPYTAANLFDVYGGASMLPLLACAIASLVWIALAAPDRRGRVVALVGGPIVAALLAWPLTIDPRPDHREVREALALITGTWTPPGHDDASELAATLRREEDADGYRRLAALYEAEGRDAEAARARRRALALSRATR